MRKLVYTFIFLFNILLFSDCFAMEVNYIIDRIKVEQTSTTAKIAKESAILNGQRQALEKLFERLNINKENLKFITTEMLGQMIESIQITDEVFSTIKYSSVLMVSFNKDFVNFHLNNLNIKPKKILDSVYLYIPILKENNNYSIIQKANVWRDATVEAFLDKQFPDIILLNNNPVNETILSKEKITNGNYDDFSTLLKSHKSNIIVFSIAEYKKESDSIEITFKEINALDSTEIKLNLFNKEKLNTNDLFFDGGEKLLVYMNDIAEKNRKKVEYNNSKNTNQAKMITDFNKDKEINIYVLFKDMNEFVFLKNVLKNLNFIDLATLKYVSTKEALFNLKLNIFVEELYTLLRDQNLLLKLKDNKYYLVYLGA